MMMASPVEVEKKGEIRAEGDGANVNPTCPYVFPVCKTCSIGDDALTGEEVVLPCIRRDPLRHTNGSDPTGVPKGNNTKASEHCNTGIRPFALVHQVLDCGENIFFVDSEFARLL